MCLVKFFNTNGEQEQFARGRVLKKPMRVFKILKKSSREGLISPYYGMVYKRGTHYYQKKDLDTNKYGINIQLYNYDNRYVARVNAGLHSYSSKKGAEEQIYLSDKYVVKTMVIPAGARIWEGQYGQIVSTELIFPHRVSDYFPKQNLHA